MTLGQRIKELRKELNIKQSELATMVGTTPQNISQYERDLRNPKITTVNKICRALGVSMDEFYEGVDLSKPDFQVDLFSGLSDEHALKLFFRLGDAMDVPPKVIKKVLEKGDTLAKYKIQALAEELLFYYSDLWDILDFLNGEGRDRVINYARDLSKIPEYRIDGGNKQGADN